jgi:xylose dehydrogenase (NAD/NADP)
LILTIGSEQKEIAVEESDRYRLEVEDFAEAIGKKRMPAFSLDETVRNAEVLDRLRAAMGQELKS